MLDLFACPLLLPVRRDHDARLRCDHVSDVGRGCGLFPVSYIFHAEDIFSVHEP